MPRLYILALILLPFLAFGLGNQVNAPFHGGGSNCPSFLLAQVLPYRLMNNQRFPGYQMIVDRLRTNCTTFTNRGARADGAIDTTLIDLITNSAYGTCICLSNGTYNLGTNMVIPMAAGTMLLGQSFSNTICVFTNVVGRNGPRIAMQRDCTVANMAFVPVLGDYFTGALGVNATPTDCTNMVVSTVMVCGDSDTLRFDSTAQMQVQIFNLFAPGHWDSILVEGANAANNFWLWNCHSQADDDTVMSSYDGASRALRFNAGVLQAYYCTFQSTNSGHHAFDVIAFEHSFTVGNASLYDCTFLHSASTGLDNNWDVRNSTGKFIRVSGGYYDATKLTGNVIVFP